MLSILKESTFFHVALNACKTYVLEFILLDESTGIIVQDVKDILHILRAFLCQTTQLEELFGVEWVGSWKRTTEYPIKTHEIWHCHLRSSWIRLRCRKDDSKILLCPIPNVLMRRKHADTGETVYPTLTVLECTVDGISGKNRWQWHGPEEEKF